MEVIREWSDTVMGFDDIGCENSCAKLIVVSILSILQHWLYVKFGDSSQINQVHLMEELVINSDQKGRGRVEQVVISSGLGVLLKSPRTMWWGVTNCTFL